MVNAAFRVSPVCLLALGVSLYAVLATPVYAGSVKLAPHRAVYEMSLERTMTGVGVTDLSGRMVYELTGDACKGYAQNMRFVTRSKDGSGRESTMDLRSRFWEDGNGRTFRFDTDQYRNEKRQDSAAGRAERRKDGADVAVRVSRPKPNDFNLKRRVLFPIQHSVELLTAARDGRSVFTSDLYDGSEKGTKIYSTTAVFGQQQTSSEIEAATPPAKGAKELDGLTAWPVSLGYFEASDSKADRLPSYELGFLFYENGVSRRLLIDYGNFAIRGRLTQLEMLKSSPCNK